MRIQRRLFVAAFALATAFAAKAGDGPTAKTAIDLPVTQRIMRDGSIRYAVWVKVGERSVEAMLDTGSTGLRVLPSVFRGELTEGVPTDVAFGAGLHMAGVAVKAPVEIGSLDGMADIEVVNDVGCVPGTPVCGVPIPGVDSYLIGGNGFPSDGYSAILGIGLPFRGTDIGNPLAALGVKQWIVELPHPYEIAEGHLILDPDDKAKAGFTMLARHGAADADGCIEGAALHERQCGTLLFDTGAPAMQVSFDGVKAATQWDEGTTGTLTFKVSKDESLKFDFKAGENGALKSVSVTPPASPKEPETFILAGVDPFLTYAILYDEPSHAVGLMKRPPASAPGNLEAAETARAPADGGPSHQRIASSHHKKAL